MGSVDQQTGDVIAATDFVSVDATLWTRLGYLLDCFCIQSIFFAFVLGLQTLLVSIAGLTVVHAYFADDAVLEFALVAVEDVAVFTCGEEASPIA